MKATRTPVREIPTGHYMCTRCGSIKKSTRTHALCRDCQQVEADLANPSRIEALDRRLDPKPKGHPTHCPHGHEYTNQNTILDNRGWIKCRTCAHEYERRARVRKAKQRQGDAA